MPWIDAGPRAALPASGMIEVEAGRLAVLLYDLDGVVHASDAICPHHAAWLSQGQISGGAIDCPRHQGRFDIATGKKLRGPECPDLQIYKTRILDGRIQLWVSPPS